MSNSKDFNQDVAFSFYTNERYAEDLIYHSGYALFYLYKDGHYVKLTPEQFRKEIISFVRQNHARQNWTINSIKDIVSWVEHECLRQTEKEDRHYIGFKDCLYNTKTFETEPHDKEKLVTYYLPYNFDETKAPTPTFDKFLSSSLVKYKTLEPDPDLISIVQEMFGSIFIDNLKACTAFFLYGESGQNGKSTLTSLLRKMIGKDFYSSLSLLDLSQRFTLSALIGKKANIADELDDRFGSSKMFKQLVQGDVVHGEHKYGGNFDLENRAKFFYSSNVMPTFDGIDGGLRRRIKIIPFYREFRNDDKDKDFDLSEKLEKEIPGIVGWALEGSKRLVENKYNFTKCEAVTQMMNEFEDEASSALRFFRDVYVVDETEQMWIPVQKVYDEYVNWMIMEGLKKCAGKKRFVKDIKGVWRGLDGKYCRYSDGDKYNGQTLMCINAYRKDSIVSEGEDVVGQLKFDT